MNPRFILILTLITATLLGWTFIHYQYQDNKQFRLQQLSELPIYIYMDSVSDLDSLSVELKTKVSQIDSLAVESGETTAQSLVQTYQLDIEPTTIQEYQLPSVLTVTFQPEATSFLAREKVRDILTGRKIPAADIDMQDAAWGLVKKEITYLKQRWSNATLFTAFIVFLMFIFARLYLFLIQSRKPKSMRETILESIRNSEARKWQSGILLGVPVLLNLGLYFLLLAFKVIAPRVDWAFFGVQFSALFTASIVAILLDSMEQPDSEEPSIIVKMDSKTDAPHS